MLVQGSLSLCSERCCGEITGRGDLDQVFCGSLSGLWNVFSPRRSGPKCVPCLSLSSRFNDNVYLSGKLSDPVTMQDDWSSEPRVGSTVLVRSVRGGRLILKMIIVRKRLLLLLFCSVVLRFIPLAIRWQ